MTDCPDSSPSTRRKTAIPGLVLCRVIVPLWILTGAMFKLQASDPRLLPKGILILADKLGFDLDWTLATLIALEFFAAGVIVFIRPLARAMAIFMLAIFCAVLIREIAAGNADCGCLGGNSPSPWVMLGIDGAILVGTVLLRPWRFPWIDRSRWSILIAGVLTGAGATAAFVKVIP